MIILIILIILVLLNFFFIRSKLFNNEDVVLDDVKLREESSNNGFALMLEQSDGTYKESSSSSWPTDMTFNSELSGCIDVNGNKIDNSLSFNSSTNAIVVSTNKTAYCYLYFDIIPLPSVYEQVIRDYTSNNGVLKLSDEDKGSRTYDTYYYTGDITNNNVIFANHCWKMVITTEGNGVKMIYNGVPFYAYSAIDKISKSEYNISTNTPSSYPFTYDSSTNEWTSGITGQDSTTNTIEFTVATAGDYVLNYSVSSASNYNKASFYKNGTALKSDISGTTRGTIDLSGLATSDVIKATYEKVFDSVIGSDTVTFSIGKGVGEKTLSCDNIGEDSVIGYSAFNSSDNSPAYVGYMYNKVYEATSKSMSLDTTYIYGNSVSWDGSNYTLVNTKSGSWSSVYSSLSNNHYTCFTTGTTCSEVYYINYANSNEAYYITLTGGVNIEDALNEMLHPTEHTMDSTIKTEIDSWYESNLLSTQDSEGNKYSSYLQNTIYCNNRATTSLGAFNPTGGSNTSSDAIYFNYNTLDCENTRDQFTLKASAGGEEGYGNNALDYPIGLLNYKEASLATASGYLDNGSQYWLLSSFVANNILFFSKIQAFGSSVADKGLGSNYVSFIIFVRPALTLSSSVKIKSGDGSISSPYQVLLNN